MTLMAFGANETPIEHAGLVYLLILSLCQEAFLFSLWGFASVVWLKLLGGGEEGLQEFKIL